MRALSGFSCLSLILAASVLGASPAAAQSCGCPAVGQAVGLVRVSVGKVLASNETGFVELQARNQLRLPARVIAGPRSQTVIQIGGDCRISVAAGSTVDISNQNGRWCPSVDEGAIAEATAAGLSLPEIAPLAAMGTVAAATAGFSANRAADRVSR